MILRNSSSEYGAVTKALHWLTVLAITTQFVLGYAMESIAEGLLGQDDSGRGRGRGAESGRGRGGDGDADEALVFAHAWVGLAIIVLAVVRLVWRRRTALPAWSDRLTTRDRRLESWLERGFYGLLFLIPSSGAALLFLSGEEREVGTEERWQPPLEVLSDDVLLVLHVASHVTFFVVLVLHVGLVLRRRTLRRMV